MKCPNDQAEMEKGFITQYGQMWAKGKPLGVKFAETLSLGGEYIYAYRCPKCEKVELTTKEGN